MRYFAFSSLIYAALLIDEKDARATTADDDIESYVLAKLRGFSRPARFTPYHLMQPHRH